MLETRHVWLLPDFVLFRFAGTRTIQNPSEYAYKLSRTLTFACPTHRVTFVIAEACLLAGLLQSAYHTGYRTVFFQNPPDCETVRRGTFGAGAAFALFTCVLTSAYYYYFSKARIHYHRPEVAIGMSPL